MGGEGWTRGWRRALENTRAHAGEVDNTNESARARVAVRVGFRISGDKHVDFSGNLPLAGTSDYLHSAILPVGLTPNTGRYKSGTGMFPQLDHQLRTML